MYDFILAVLFVACFVLTIWWYERQLEKARLELLFLESELDELETELKTRDVKTDEFNRAVDMALNIVAIKETPRLDVRPIPAQPQVPTLVLVHSDGWN